MRTWYGHKPERFTDFKAGYREELTAAERRTALGHLTAMLESATVTLLTATKDVEHSHATVLAELLEE